MTPPVSVHLLPRLMDPRRLAGSVAVVIDVLRASTTIVHALAHGATSVRPFEAIDEARAAAVRLPSETILLGGERGGKPIDGFDLGNSPLDYTQDRVAGKTVLFTTTNGTKALRLCEPASRVLIGAFVNRSALLRVLRADGRPVHLICAGTDGQLTAEDILFAGAVAADLCPVTADVQTQMAIDYHRVRSADEATFRETIRQSRGGQNLLSLGMDADVERSSQCDLFHLIPEWHAATNQIVPAGADAVNQLPPLTTEN